MPPSSAFKANTAWAVVPEPAKESSTTPSEGQDEETRNWIKLTGFGKLKGVTPLKICFKFSVPLALSNPSIKRVSKARNLF